MWTHVIGFRDTVIGFRLLGIEGTIINNIKNEDSINQVKNLIKQLQRRQDYGLIIINEKIAEKLEDLILSIKINHENIIIIEIPDRSGSIKPRLDLNYIIQKVVGMKI